MGDEIAGSNAYSSVSVFQSKTTLFHKCVPLLPIFRLYDCTIEGTFSDNAWDVM